MEMIFDSENEKSESRDNSEKSKRREHLKKEDLPPVRNAISTFAQRNSSVLLSREGRDFIEDVKEKFTNVGYKFKHFEGSISSMLIYKNDPTNSKNEAAILIGFVESIRGDTTASAAVLLLHGAKEAYEKQGFDVIQVVVIGPEEYNRVNQWFINIDAHFLWYYDDEETKLTADSFSNTEVYTEISCSVDEALQFYMDHGPHAVPPRADYAMCLKMKNKDNRDSRNNTEVVAAIYGYVDFYAQTQGRAFSKLSGYGSLLHTEFFSTIPDPNIMFIIYKTLVQKFVMEYEWLYNFKEFTANDPILGNLIEDEDGKPWIPKDDRARTAWETTLEWAHRDFINLSPTPVMDITLGRLQPPIIHFISKYNNVRDNVFNKVANFFEVSVDEIPELFIGDHVTNSKGDVTFIPECSGEDYTGVVTVEYHKLLFGHVRRAFENLYGRHKSHMTSQHFDSRYIDYLCMMKNDIPPDAVKTLLEYYNDPTIRAKCISKTYQAIIEFRYINKVYEVNPAFVEFINDRLDEFDIDPKVFSSEIDVESRNGVFSKREHRKFNARLTNKSSRQRSRIKIEL